MSKTETDAAKYLKNGTEVEVLATFSGGMVVQAVIENEDSEPYFGSPFITDRVFDVPPTERQHESIARLSVGLEQLRKEHSALNKEVADLYTLKSEIEAMRKKHKAFRRIEDCLEGRITHWCLIEYSGPKIVTLEEALAIDDQYDREKFKLVTLWGKHGAGLEFQINRYSDGSGGGRTAYPCTSEEEAIAFAKSNIEERIANTLDRPSTDIAKMATDFGVPMPDGYRRAAIEAAIVGIQSRITEQTKDCDKNTAKVTALEAELTNKDTTLP